RHNLLWQTELGNAVHQHTAGRMQRLKDRDLVSLAGKVAGAGQAGGTGADNRDLVPVGGHPRGQLLRLGVVAVGHIALEAPDTDRLTLDPPHAFALALGFLRADPAADRRKRAGVGNDAVSLLKLSGFDL